MGVVRNGSPEAFVGHGFADIASRTPITEDTVFHVGSLTKTFTAIAVMQLHERGLVDLDAPVGDHLRAFRLSRGRRVAPRHRPAPADPHRRHPGGAAPVGRRAAAVRRNCGERAAGAVGGLRIEAEPGTRFRYTDHGFATLGQLVEDVTGQPFATYLRDRVVLPPA